MLSNTSESCIEALALEEWVFSSAPQYQTRDDLRESQPQIAGLALARNFCKLWDATRLRPLFLKEQRNWDADQHSTYTPTWGEHGFLI